MWRCVAYVLCRGGRGAGNASISKEFDLALLIDRQLEIGIGADGNEGVGWGRHDVKVGDKETAQVRSSQWAQQGDLEPIRARKRATGSSGPTRW